MTRKKFIKKAMSQGVSRNKAAAAAACFRLFKLPYKSLTLERVVPSVTADYATVTFPLTHDITDKR